MSIIAWVMNTINRCTFYCSACWRVLTVCWWYLWSQLKTYLAMF